MRKKGIADHEMKEDARRKEISKDTVRAGHDNEPATH